ncbi:MAG: hypothetical protein ABSB50_15045 [Terracidiphilus sp.]|jgi:hypothetical protein
MSWRNKLAGEVDDPMVAEALRNFKASVDAWSDAAYSRPRAGFTAARRTWRLAATLAMGCLLVAGSVTAAVVERHHQQELAHEAAIKAAAQKAALEPAPAAQPADSNVQVPNVRTDAAAQPAAASATNEDADLLATVDRDVSREVPAAMDPLAQLMNENGSN